MRKGIGVSPGVAIGSAYCIREIFVDPATKKLAAEEVQPELARFAAARDETTAELKALARKVERQLSDEEAAIFRMHESILNDPAFEEKIRQRISEDRLSAQAALHESLNEYIGLFTRTTDPFLRERLSDVRDVVIRLSSKLSDVFRPELCKHLGPLIVVAEELLPSHVVTLGDRQIAGIVTEAGGKTSHAAILARSRGIPAVSGVTGILRSVENGEEIIVDGGEGVVIPRPNSEIRAAYRKRQRELLHLQDVLAANRTASAQTACGETISLLANINSAADAAAATRMGADGIGLYRTEYLFLVHSDVPSEEEQVDAYREVIAAAPPGPIVIRTLDIGGDKTIPYLGMKQEPNPFLGWRSIRISFEHPEFFLAQIRAVLRASAEAEPGRVRLMFPMIATLEETRRVRALVRRAIRQLEDKGIAYGKTPLGLMVETPSSAIVIDRLAAEVEFVSIGSNDLVQYLMAADRDNPKVNHLCQPLSPAVLRVLRTVIISCRRADTPVTVCGEMAGSPSGFVVLLGMGLRSFSMSPALIPTIKELAGKLTVASAKRIVRDAMERKTTSEVRRYVRRCLSELAPEIAGMESE